MSNESRIALFQYLTDNHSEEEYFNDMFEKISSDTITTQSQLTDAIAAYIPD
jgi:hypothetical protein